MRRSSNYNPRLDFSDKPALVFWETTRACALSCKHCRASAILKPLPGELTTAEGFRLIDDVASFGSPAPVMILTGGDPMRRKDIYELMRHARESGVRFAVSPAVTSGLTADTLAMLKESGAASISVSLDGSTAEMHDTIRGENMTFVRTLQVIRDAVSMGLGIQVNTAVMKDNISQLPELFATIRGLGVKTWEVFFLIRVGRGTGVDEISPEECETVCNFLYDASMYGMTVRTVEAPFIRRVAAVRNAHGGYWDAPEYIGMRSYLRIKFGEPTGKPAIAPRGTLDGDGIIFVAYDGTVHPGGFLPLKLGNVRASKLVDIYRSNAVMKSIRGRRITGVCGSCEYKDICGGSRARAYASRGDALASDPACILCKVSESKQVSADG